MASATFDSITWWASLFVTADRMRVYLVLEPGEGAGASEAPPGAFAATPEAVSDALAALGVEASVDEAGVLRACLDPCAVCTPIAWGTDPVPGEDARVDILLDDPADRSPLEREDGRVDYRERGPWLRVDAGAELLRLHPPGEGVEGRDVFGAVLPTKPGRSIRVEAGRGVRASEANGIRSYVSAAPGRPVVRRRTEWDLVVEVRPLLEIEGDVGLGTGHVRFEGDVAVAGDVADDMVVEATGDVLVRGTVSRSEIRAGKSVEIRGGAFQSVIEAGGRVHLTYAHHATVTAGERIEVERRGAYLCRLEAPQVMVRGPVVGGEVHAGEQFEASEAGSEMGAATLLATEASGVLRVRTAHPRVRLQVGRHTRLLEETEPNLVCRIVNGELSLR